MFFHCHVVKYTYAQFIGYQPRYVLIISNFLFIPEHFEIISNGHKTLSSMVYFIRQMDNT